MKIASRVCLLSWIVSVVLVGQAAGQAPSMGPYGTPPPYMAYSPYMPQPGPRTGMPPGLAGQPMGASGMVPPGMLPPGMGAPGMVPPGMGAPGMAPPAMAMTPGLSPYAPGPMGMGPAGPYPGATRHLPAHGPNQSIAYTQQNIAPPSWPVPSVAGSMGCDMGCDSGCDACDAPPNWEGAPQQAWSAPGLFRRFGSNYFGLDYSGAFGIDDSTATIGSGLPGLNGTGSADMSDGYGIGARIGYQVLPEWRTDVSYQFYESDYNWSARFAGGATNRYQSNLKTHLILVNWYYHPTMGFATYDPYVGVGVGIAINDISDAQVTFPAGTPGSAVVRGDSYVDYAGRLTTGVLIPVTAFVHLDINCSATYIGNAQTNNIRTLNTGAVQRINPFVFDNNWLGAVSIGLLFTR